MTTALITNDDGIESPGIPVLAAAARSAGLDVVVAAPSWDSSGASASLTGVRRDGRLLLERRDVAGVDGPAYAVEASPALIALTALRGGFGDPPDLVLSGVNRGRNTGHAVLHSGTVGAVLTARNEGVGGLAVSLDAAAPLHWDTAEAVAAPVIAWLDANGAGAVLNLNVPDVERAELAGLRQAPLAAIGAVQTNVTDVAEGYVQLTFGELDREPRPGTDAAFLDAGWATLTAIQAVCEAPGYEALDALGALVG